MSMDDDLFKDPVNDDDMNMNEEDEDEDEEMGMGMKNDDANQDQDQEDEDGDADEDDEDEGEDEEEEDEDEEGDGDGEEQDPEGENSKNMDDDMDIDDTKFMDAKETQENDEEFQKNKDSILEQFRDDLREEEEKAKNEHEANGDLEIKDDASAESNAANDDGLTFRERVVLQAKAATKYDIIPTVAIPYASQCHSIAFSEGPRWILTGGEDGFIRKYDFVALIEGKLPLTMAQKHNLVDTVTKAGVIVSYWENEQPQLKQEILKSNPKLKEQDFAAGSANYEPKLSPVYALDVERNGYWCLSGLAKGGVSLHTMRYNEGYIHWYFKHGTRQNSLSLAGGHRDTISVLKLNHDQTKFLSGSWDKTIREWDLSTGACTNLFTASTGQVSNIQYRPYGLGDMLILVDSNDGADESASGAAPAASGDAGSDMDSLFGDSDEEEDGDSGERGEKVDKAPVAPSVNKSSISNKKYTNESIFMSSSIDGTINIWDVRESHSNSVIKFAVPENTPPWCMSSTWSNCGDYIYAGRRNSTVEEFSIKMPHKNYTKNSAKGGVKTPNVLKTLNFPKISGPISSISTMPNNDYLLCGSNDNIRLYNLSLYNGGNATESTTGTGKGKPATPFMIIPGHHGGVLSALWLDDTGRFMVSASGNRGWGHANYTETVLLYEIDFE